MLPGPVENLDVFQLHTNTSPELHSICSIVFVASLNGAIGMSSKEKGHLIAKYNMKSSTIQKWPCFNMYD